jgi:hypothetical protein
MRKTIFMLLLLSGFWPLQKGLAADVTLYAGIQNPGKLTIGNAIRDTKTGGVFGARFSGGRVLGFEQTLGFSSNFLESNQRAFNTQSNLLLGIPVDRVVPYGTVGIGFITTFGDSVRTFGDIGTKFTVNYGGGLKFRSLSGPLGLRVDIRGYSVPRVFNQTLNFVEGSIGLLFSW